VEAALRTHLLDDASIAALVGTRIYPIRAPQGETTLPRIVYQRIGNETLISHEGFGGHQTTQIQIKVVASTYAGAKALAKLVEQQAEAFRGTIADTLITGCDPQGQIDLPQELAAGADQGPSAVVQEWLVSWRDD
jgi:hypothetical protein